MGVRFSGLDSAMKNIWHGVKWPNFHDRLMVKA